MVLTAASYPDEEVQRIAAEMRIRERRYLEVYAWSTRLGLMRITPEKYLPEMLSVYFGALRRYLPPEAAECEIAFLHQTRHVQSFAIESGRPAPDEESEEVAACNPGFGDRPLVPFREMGLFVRR
jgi:hypothetical protein